MSTFFQPRQRFQKTATSNRSGSGGGGGGGSCYAIANDSSSGSGIYFSRDEATQKILEIRSTSTSNSISPSQSDSHSNHHHPHQHNQNQNVGFCGFDKVTDAEAFLRDRGFAPAVESGGWISARNKNPILYTPSRAMKEDGGNGNNNDNGIITTHDVKTREENRRRRAEVTPMAESATESRIRSSTNGNGNGASPIATANEWKMLWANHQHGTEEANESSSSYFSPSAKRSKREQERVRKRQRPEAKVKFEAPLRNGGNGNSSGMEISSSVGTAKTIAVATTVTAAKTSDFFAPTTEFDAVQQEAIDAALAGKNVFLTGVAGTGKSLVTKKIVQDAKLLRKEVVVAAPTGVAAVNLGPELGAQTVHSLAGVGVPQTASNFEKMLAPYIVKKWKNIEVLVLDEVGMLSADFLDWMDVYVRKARRKPLKAFGGIQLIFVGDFAQLGPIPGKGHSLRRKTYSPDEPGADCMLGISECAAYAFQTVLWREADFHHMHLKTVYRQKNKDFQLALLDIREAKADSQRVQDLVETCSKPLEDREGLQIPQGIEPTILYCTNRNVDRENFENLSILKDKGKPFEATDSTSIASEVGLNGREFVERMLTKNAFFKDCSASKTIHLKVGAQVMLLQNLDLQRGLVNGSRGVVKAFKLCPVIKDIIHGEERLVGPDDVETFFPGCRFEDLKFNKKADFEGKIWRIRSFDRFPLVQFINGTSKIIVPSTFERTLYRQGKCTRLQIPLRLAWALTIHKSQGATLDYVVCDLQGCFTSGQAYVALSRARSMLGLQIKNFHSKHVTADPLVEAFYDALDRRDTTTFLEEKAGLWWYPILKSPSWLNMFQRASSKTAKVNSEQFRSWVAEYKPLEGYRGWGA